MNWLDGYLQDTLEGRGGIVFVTGGPGRGKTTLLEAFSRKVSEESAELLIAWGECSAFTGLGDPYLPFRQVMGMLTGDLESRWASGRISRQEAEELWEAMPVVVREVVEVGPDLIDVFASGVGMLSRVRIAVEGSTPWIERLATLTEQERSSRNGLDQRSLFDQVEVVLSEIAEKHPLLLVLDDLQWADSASINLLFHLARRLAGRRVLIVGAYRPEEIALGRRGEPHPLKLVLAELKRQYGDVWIDLGTVEDKEARSFVELYINSEPNRLSEGFQEALFLHTGGHALFTVELLRVLQERGDLFLDEDGLWVEGRELDWSVLPARVEGVIEERIGRLEDELRETLSIASVEGEDFTAQVVARVQQVGESKLIKRLSRELEKKHRLVRSRDEAKVGEHYLSLYRFTHILFQRFLYNDLSAAERRTMHGQVAMVLEELYAGETDAITVQLANHYAEAGEADKAIEHLEAAGDRARLVFANEEAIQFYERALELQKEMDYDDQAARTLMKLGLTYYTAFDFKKSRDSFDEAFDMHQRVWATRPETPEPAPHPLRRVMSEPTTFDPCICYDGISWGYISGMFSGLMEIGLGWEIIPNVVQSWEISEDGTRYLFHLRDDVYWSDGTQVTAEDFAYSLKRTLNPTTKASIGRVSLFFDIKNAMAYNKGEISEQDQVGVREIDELTLEVELEQVASYFLHMLVTLYPVPRHVVEAYGDAWTNLEHIVTNGPFQIESYKPGESMNLVRNPTYHGRFSGNLERVEFSFSERPFSIDEFELYERDSVDVAHLGEATYYASLASQKYADEFVSFPQPGTLFVGFDTSRPPFDDVDVRRALVMAVDRERLVDDALGGLMSPATGGLVPPAIPGHSPGIGLPYDPEQAQRLMANAGYPDGQGFPTVEITWVRESPSLEYLKSEWIDNLNVQLAVQTTDWKNYVSTFLNRNAHFIAVSAEYPDPDWFLRVTVRTDHPHWIDERYDRLLDEAQRTFDQGERIRLYQEADKILIEKAVTMPLAYFRVNRLCKPWVKLPARGIDPMFLQDVIIEPH